MFLKHLWNENFAYIPCISLRTRSYWLSLAGNSVICILFLDFVRFAIWLLHFSLSLFLPEITLYGLFPMWSNYGMTSVSQTHALRILTRFTVGSDTNLVDFLRTLIDYCTFPRPLSRHLTTTAGSSRPLININHLDSCKISPGFFATSCIECLITSNVTPHCFTNTLSIVAFITTKQCFGKR